ncbi:MAG: PcfJ domain-containing protein [Clostridia bacterium]|nr:PcfJ domain-containing protein [Clostridia bacterium]
MGWSIKRMSKAERDVLAEEIRKKLPFEPSSRAKSSFMAEPYGEYLSTFRSVMIQRDGRSVRAVRVMCGACLFESHYEYYRFSDQENEDFRYRHPGCASDPYGFYDPKDQIVKQTHFQFVCPECRRSSTLFAYSRRLYRSLASKDQFAQDLLNIDGHAVIVLWKLHKWINREGVENFSFDRLYASYQVGGFMYRANGYLSWYGNRDFISNWVQVSHFSEIMNGVQKKVVFYEKKDLQKVEEWNEGLKALLNFGTPSTYLFLERYLLLWSKSPAIENVSKTFPSYLYRVFLSWDQNSRKGFAAANFYFDLKKTKPNEICRVRKEDAKRLLLGKYDPIEIRLYNLLRSSGYSDPDQVFKIGLPNCESFLRFLNDPTTKRVSPSLFHLFNYVQKNHLAYVYLCDYWRMTLETEGSIAILFPKDLQRAHDRATERYQSKKDRVKDQKVKERFKLLEKFSFSDPQTGLLIRPVRSIGELTLEGHKLHHCVASYATSVSEGRTSIFLIRKIEDPETPFFTLEYREDQVVQNRGFHNCDRTPEVISFESKWLQYIKRIKGGKQNGKRSGQETRERVGA